MLSLPPTVRIWLSAQPADLRKSFDSLAAMVREGLQGDPLSGDIFVFRNKAADRDQAPGLGGGWIRDLVQAIRGGSFRFPLVSRGPVRVEVRAADLVMLFEGIDLRASNAANAITAP